MTNMQPAEPIVQGTGERLDVHSIWNTIQGEGPFVGIPAVFLRLAGCQLLCFACDSEYTEGRKERHLLSVLAEVERLAIPTNVRLVVITGGEPFRQPIWQLINKLVDLNYRVQIETNGAAYQKEEKPRHPWVSIVCSPKTAKIHPDIRPNAFKYVLDWEHVDPNDGLPTTTLMNEGKVYRPPNLAEYMDRNAVYVQPMDAGDPEQNKRNMDAAVQSCLKWGYRLCLQTHKIVGLP